MKNKKTKKKVKFEELDDGRTIANMNVEGFKWYMPQKQRQNQKELKNLQISKKEKRAITKAAFLSTIPVILMYLSAFILFFFLIILWLR